MRIDIKAGYRHCLALNSDGKVYGWGNNTNGELGKDGMYGRMVKVYKNDYAMFFYSEKPIVIPNVNNATFIETGREFSMFITKDGNILSCGKNGCNQLGRTRTTNIVGNVENDPYCSDAVSNGTVLPGIRGRMARGYERLVV